MAAAFLVALYEYLPLFYIALVFTCFIVTTGLVLGCLLSNFQTFRTLERIQRQRTFAHRLDSAINISYIYFPNSYLHMHPSFWPPSVHLILGCTSKIRLDVQVVLRNSEETQLSTRVFKKQMRQVKNPFGLEIANPSAASITTGVTFITDCLEDSHLTCYWGCSVQKLYEALQKHVCYFRISTPQALEDALCSEYLYKEQYFIKKDSKEEINCQLPRDTKIEDFGTVPRSRYPLVALLTLADKDDREIYDIISMVSVIHIPDKTYKLSCRILYQYLFLAQGQFHDLKQLFMSANNSTPSSSPSPEDKIADQSLLEKAGLSESEGEPLEESSKDCVVCQNGSVNWVLLPCRHACLCDSCVRFFQRCPMCRQFVQESFSLCSQREQEKDN